MLYAPQCHLGFLNFDKSGGFITIPDQYVMFTKREKAELNGDEIEVSLYIFLFFVIILLYQILDQFWINF